MFAAVSSGDPSKPLSPTLRRSSNALVETATVNADGGVVFAFRNGVEIRQKP